MPVQGESAFDPISDHPGQRRCREACHAIQKALDVSCTRNQTVQHLDLVDMIIGDHCTSDDAILLDGTEQCQGTGPRTDALRTGLPVLVGDFSTDPRWAIKPSFELAFRKGSRASRTPLPQAPGGQASSLDAVVRSASTVTVAPRSLPPSSVAAIALEPPAVVALPPAAAMILTGRDCGSMGHQQ